MTPPIAAEVEGRWTFEPCLFGGWIVTCDGFPVEWFKHFERTVNEVRKRRTNERLVAERRASCR